MAKRKMDKMMNTEDEEFPSNSKASQAAPVRQDVVAVIEAREEAEDKPTRGYKRTNHVDDKPKAFKRRKSITRSIRETFFNEDSKNVMQFVLVDVLVPAAKSMISDMFTKGIEMMLFGEGGSGRVNTRSRDRDNRTTIQYGNMYRRDEERRPMSRRDRFGLDDIFFRNGKEATDVLSDLCDLLEKYEQVSVQDFYDLAQVDGAQHTYSKWGWTSLKRAYCTYTREGHMIVLPPPEELD